MPPPLKWQLAGTVLIACNCDWGCPCNFNAMPSKGFCEGGWTWHIDKGSADDITLDGLNFSVIGKWPGAIHHGNGEGLVLVDQRATAGQSDAIAAIVSGKFGGPWAILAWTWPKVYGPKPVPYRIHLDGLRSTVSAGDSMHLTCTTIRNPVTGADAHPGISLPEGLIVKEAELGASATFRVDDGIAFDHSGQFMAIGKFSYAWP